MTAPIALVHEGCGTRHITVNGADNDLRKALTIARQGVHRARTVLRSQHRTDRDRYKPWEAAEQERQPLNRGTPDNKVEAMEHRYRRGSFFPSIFV